MKYGPEMTQEIASYLKEGAGRVDSCQMAGISYETFTQWMKKPEFSETIKTAEAECKHRHIKVIWKAADKHWQAAAWWLERKHQDEFALRQKVEVTDGERPSTEALIGTIRELREQLKHLRGGAEVANPK